MDDGSKFRHTTVSFILALILSVILPIGGYFAAVKIGVMYEKGKTDPDSQQDIKYDKNGAHWGSMLGSGIGLFLYYVLFFRDI